MKISTLHKRTFVLVALLSLLLTACNDYLSTDLPEGELSFEDGIQTQQDLEEMINSIYDVIANTMGGQGQRLAELLGQDVELIGNTGDLIQIYNRSTDFFNGASGDWYRQPYFVIYRANTLLEQIDRVEVDPQVKDRMSGEAYIARAYGHMELVKLFAQPYGYTDNNSHLGIVLRTSTFTTPIPRATVAEVYDQVEADLQQARQLLPTSRAGDVFDGSDAAALLARLNFYKGNYEEAGNWARMAIDESGLELGPYGSRYAVDEAPADALFYIVSTTRDDNRARGWTDNLSSLFGVPVMRAAAEVDDLLAEHPGDVRRSDVDTLADAGSEALVYTKFNEEYFNTGVLTVTELYYILAESLLRSGGDVMEARDLLNEIRDRNEIPQVASGNREVVLGELLLDKRKEFLGEGINLWDLKRRGAIHNENIFIREAPWNCDGMVLQFPASELTVEEFELNPEAGCN